MPRWKRLTGRSLILLFALIFLLIPSPSFSDDTDNINFLLNNYSFKQKESFEYQKPVLNRLFTFNELVFLGRNLIRLYQTFISSQDLTVCMFHPHCSLYADWAINEYGAFQGGLMSSDRVLRCNGFGSYYYPDILPDGKIFDPPEYNALWQKNP